MALQLHNPEPHENPYAPPQVASVPEPNELIEHDRAWDAAALLVLAQAPIEVHVEPTVDDWFEFEALRRKRRRPKTNPTNLDAFTWTFPMAGIAILLVATILPYAVCLPVLFPSTDNSMAKVVTVVSFFVIAETFVVLPALVVSYLWMRRLRRMAQRRQGFFRAFECRISREGLTLIRGPDTERTAWGDVASLRIGENGLVLEPVKHRGAWMFLPHRSFTNESDWSLMRQLAGATR